MENSFALVLKGIPSKTPHVQMRVTAPARASIRCRASLGIDLGTTNSLACIIHDNKPVPVLFENGSALVPSIVQYGPEGPQLAENITGSDTCHSVKRLIGRKVTDVQDTVAHLSYQVSADDAGFAVIDMPAHGLVSPQQVSSEILKVLKRQAERAVGEEIDRAVITVPAHFGNDQRLATMEAAMLSGIERSSLLQEPVAAALAYGLNRTDDEQPLLLVFDLGGGTFDVSLLQSFEGILEVVASDGDNQLGGFDLDTLVVDLLLSKSGERKRILSEGAAMKKLRSVAEGCKKRLSTADRTQVDVELPGQPARQVELTTAELKEAAQPFLKRLWAPLERLACDCKVQLTSPLTGEVTCQTEASTHAYAAPPRRVTQLLLVGGATKAPIIADFAAQACGRSACAGVDPEECVAIGAAVQAGVMEGSVTGALEMTDSIYVQGLQGRVSGFQM